MIRLVIPAYDEAGSLENLLPRLPQFVLGHEVVPLVVSDGSRDGTVDIARQSGVSVLDLQPNSGKGTAIRAGLRAIEDLEFDVVVFMDADGQHDPDDLARLVTPLRKGEADIVVASRYRENEGRGNTPRNRYIVRSGTVVLLHRILGIRFTDPYCGFRAFSRAALESIEFCGSRYEGELEVLFDSCRSGLAVVEIPIKRVYGRGTSKMFADGGRLIGRLRVIRQYTVTIVRKTRQLRSAADQARVNQ